MCVFVFVVFDVDDVYCKTINRPQSSSILTRTIIPGPICGVFPYCHLFLLRRT